MAKSKVEYWLTDEGLLLIGAWARDGLTDEQIAKNIGITRETLRVWKNKYSAISVTLKKNKAVVDFEVENALLKRALGYEYTETKTIVSENGTRTETTVKQVVPDTTAQIFWLKNRKPDDWRDKKDVDVGGSVHSVISSMTDDELTERIANLKGKLGVVGDE